MSVVTAGRPLTLGSDSMPGGVCRELDAEVFGRLGAGRVSGTRRGTGGATPAAGFGSSSRRGGVGYSTRKFLCGGPGGAGDTTPKSPRAAPLVSRRRAQKRPGVVRAAKSASDHNVSASPLRCYLGHTARFGVG